MIGKRPAKTMRRDDCDTMRPLLQASQDGELLPVESARLQSHLATCQACAREARELQSLTGFLRNELDPEVPLPAGAAIVGRILERPVRPAWRPRFGAFAVPALVALAAVALILPRLVDPLPHSGIRPGPPVAVMETAHVPELVVLDDERSGRQVLLAPAVTSARQEEGLNP